MSWIRGTSTGHINLSNDVRAACLGTSVLTVAVNAGGTGYTVGDILTFVGGTSTIVAQCEVSSVSSGVIDGVRMYNGGVYSVAATPTTANGVTGGTGTSATMDITNGTHGWISDRDTAYSGSQREVIMHGTGGGSDAIYIGWKTWEDIGAVRYNWECHGMTGFDDGSPAGSLNINQQPGVNPGEWDNAVTSIQKGAYLPLVSTSMDWFLSVTSFRIILSVHAGSGYFQLYAGFINRYATSTEYPYPLCVAASSDYPNVTPSTTQKMSSLTDPWSDGNINEGPLHLIDPSGTWQRFGNATISGTTLNLSNATNITIPSGQPGDINTSPLQDRWTPVNAAHSWQQLIPTNGAIGAAPANLEPTPGTGNDYYVLFPTMLLRSTDTGSTQQFYGELDDVFWVGVFGGVTSEDRIIQTDVYRVFVNCNRGGLSHEFLAIKET